MSLRVVGEAEFDEVVLKSPVPVLVDFFTVWCGPCKALAPTLADLAEEYEGRVRIVSVDAEESPGLKEKYDVSGYPTMVLVKDGAEVSRPGVRTRMQLRAVLDDALGVSRSDATPTSEIEVPSPLRPVLDGLLALDEAAWKHVDAVVADAAKDPAPERTPAVVVDEEAMTAAMTRLRDDTEELAAKHAGEGPLATGIAGGVEAAFDRWVRRTPPPTVWTQTLRYVPGARMSPYLPEGPAPDDLELARSRCVDSLAALDDAAWQEIRVANQDFFPWEGNAKRVGMSAWLAAVMVIQSVVSSDLIPAEVHDVVWAPFAGVLERELVA